MKHVIKLSTIVVSLLLSSQSFANNQESATQVDKRHVNQVLWHKSDMNKPELSNQQIPDNMSRLIFIRPQDNQPLQTSINIGVDGDFQTSLQGGHYSEVLACSGDREVSANITGIKINNLLANAEQFDLKPQQTYYFYVDINDYNQTPRIRLITPESAQSSLNSKARQNHQISRVVPENCQPYQPKVNFVPLPITPVVSPAPAVVINKPITLDVLFDVDSTHIKNTYSRRISEVAQFLQDNPNANVVIEGHTDNTGREAHNRTLSQNRANAVKLLLLNQYGIDPSRLTTVGYGSAKPIASNQTEQGRQQNRRVVAIITAN